MLKLLGVVLLLGGIGVFVFPGLPQPIVHGALSTDMLRAGGAGVSLLGLFLWWPSRE